MGLAWSIWLKETNFDIPNGPSAKIPDESVMVLLLEWIRRLNELKSLKRYFYNK